VRSNYTCQLLLSSILTHIADLCELVASAHRSPFAPEQAQTEYFDRPQQRQPAKDVKTAVVEATNLATEVGEFLKRKPLNGFQVLGRHESHHIELDLRLQRALSKLD
jgi:hypothetical protein